MPASYHFLILHLQIVAQISQTGIQAYFVLNTLRTKFSHQTLLARGWSPDFNF